MPSAKGRLVRWMDFKSVLLNSTPVALDSEGNSSHSGVTVVFRAEQEQTPPEGFELRPETVLVRK
ncbi:hypothetical protein KCP71_02215 [Salmonella enterica subsp. enterica]|nr:hypothetical protein KCP71_02215 [Salmonella enterica subsp. enterica]